jgi:8-oxo-dGTP pyrophosphatase MutT (NUDIX family)
MSREEGIQKIEAHVGCLCIDESEGKIRCLIAKRNQARKLYPDLWEGGGGLVRPNESFPDAVKRQMREEFGLKVRVLFPFCDYTIETEGGIIPGIRFLCCRAANSEIRLDGKEHAEYAWVLPEDLDRYALIPGVAEDIQKGIALYSQRKAG